MNLESLYNSKIFIILGVAGIIIFLVVTIFFLNQSTSDIKQIGEPLTKSDIAKISTSVAEDLSDAFKPDELVVNDFKGDHNWAIASVSTKSGKEDGGFVLMKRVNDKWEVVYGPATDYYKEDLLKMGAPESLIDQVDNLGS